MANKIETITEPDSSKSHGYILLHRVLLDAPYFKDAHYVQLWVYLLFRANHKDVKYKGIFLKKGSFITSRRRIAEATWIGESKVQRMLKYLEDEQEIEQQNCGKFRIITIVDWDKFQKVNSKSNYEGTMKEQWRNNERTQCINDINVNNKYIGDFEKIWKEYPHDSRTKKQECKKIFLKHCTNEEKEKEFNQALSNYKISKKVKDGYIKNSDTWFRDWETWIDYIPTKEKPRELTYNERMDEKAEARFNERTRTQ